MRQRRLSAGLCIYCGERPFRPGLQSCATCGEASKLRNKKRRMQQQPSAEVQRLRIALSQAKWEREAAMEAARQLQRESAPALLVEVQRLRADLEDAEAELAALRSNGDGTN